MSARVHQLFAGVAIALVSVAVIWGFMIVGSPAAERLRKLDERRVDDLKTIQSEILNIVYEGVPWSERAKGENKPLPETLEQVAQRARVRRVSLSDPVTGKSYEYRVIDEKHFELCATFELPRNRSSDVGWNHPPGRHCFSFDVKADGPTHRSESKLTGD